MWRRLPVRHLWIRNQQGNEQYRKEILQKKAKYPVTWMKDPLVQLHALNPGGMESSISSLASYYMNKQGIQITPNALGYLVYNCAKENISDDKLWNNLEFQLIKNIDALSPRLLYGCYFGFMRLSKGETRTLEILQKEFEKKVVKELEPMECFEMLEATSYFNRTDYDFKPFMRDHIVSQLVQFWKFARFFNSPTYFFRLLETLQRLEFYDSEIWEHILEIYSKKSCSDSDKWVPLYESLIRLQGRDIDQLTGLDFTSEIKRFEEMWENSDDLRWKYNLQEKRYYTVHEMVEKADQGPEEVTWQYGEKYIQHTLPEWYWAAEKGIDQETQSLLEEYEFIRRQSKNKKK